MPIQVSNPDIWTPNPVAPPVEAQPDSAAGAAFRLESMVTSWAVRDSDTFQPDPEFDAITHLDSLEPQYAPYFKQLGKTQSLPEFEQEMTNINRELKDRQTIAKAGAKGVAWSVAAAVLDPVSLASMAIPVAGEARLGMLGKNIGKLATETAALGGGFAAFEESMLQATQSTRTWQESVAAVGGATILGGMLGGAAGTYGRSQLNKMAAAVESDLQDIVANKGLVDASRSMGAAQVGTLSGEGSELLGPAFSPLLRMLKNPAVSARTLVNELLGHNLFIGKNRQAADILDDQGRVIGKEDIFEASSQPVETLINRDIRGMTVKYIDSTMGQWKAYKARAGREAIPRPQFMEEIGRAMRRGDESEIPEVAKAAAAIRRDVFNPIAARYQAVGELPEDLQASFAKSYFSRLYDVKKIDTNREEWMGLLTRHFSRKLLDADDLAKMAPAKRAAAERSAEFEARQIAIQVTHRIKNTPLGQLQRELIPPDAVGKAGALKERTLDIPDEELEPFLVSNADRVLQHHLRTMVPELNLTERFGSKDMKDQLAGIAQEYDELIKNAKTAKERKRLEALQNEALNDARGVRDVLLGRYGIPTGEPSRLLKAGRIARSMTFMAQLGMMTLSAMPDLARPIMQHGLLPWAKSLPKAFSQLSSKVRLEQKTWRQVGIGADNYLNSRIYLFGDLDFAGEVMERQTARFAKWSGMNAWNTAMKTIAANVAQNRFIDDALRYDKLSSARKARLAKAGFSAADARKIAAEVEKNGEKLAGSWIANTEKWSDPILADKFQVALLKDVDNTIVTPGAGDKPLFAQTELGKMLTQFKSFFISSHTQMLLPVIQSLSRGEINALTGVSAAVGVGMISEMARMHLSGRGDELESYKPQDWLRAGLDRSGVLALPFEAFNITDRAAQGRLSKAMDLAEGSRYFMRNDVGALLGPSAGYAEDMYGVLVEPLREGDQFTQSDLHSIRRLLPYQNHFALRLLLNKLEEGAGDALDLPEREQRSRRGKPPGT